MSSKFENYENSSLTNSMPILAILKEIWRKSNYLLSLHFIFEKIKSFMLLTIKNIGLIDNASIRLDKLSQQLDGIDQAIIARIKKLPKLMTCTEIDDYYAIV